MRILTTLAVKGVLDDIGPHVEGLVSSPLELVLDPTAVMLKRIAAGERGDVAILTEQGIARLAEEGYVDPSSRVDLARSVVGFAVRAGAPKPDIATLAAFKQTLRDARSIVYSKGGASGIFFAALITRLGLADEVNAKATIIPAGFTAEVVARGQADLAVQQISELMTVAGVDIVGPFPPEAQESLMFTGAVFTGAARAADARALLKALATPRAAVIFESKGLLPVARPALAT